MSLLDHLPKPPALAKDRPRLTAEHKTAILQAIPENQWKTAREAYGWAWTTLGLRVTYVTFWRFMTSEGLLVGETPCARRLCSFPKSAVNQMKPDLKLNGQV